MNNKKAKSLRRLAVVLAPEEVKGTKWTRNKRTGKWMLKGAPRLYQRLKHYYSRGLHGQELIQTARGKA